MNITKDAKFWVVTIPTKDSTFNDIWFESDLHKLRLQFLGGLTAETIHGIFDDKETAKRIATNLLKFRNSIQ
jgi:hypothetical protein